MTRYAVAYMSYTDNELTIEVFEADNWLSALAMHSKIDFLDIPNDMSAAKTEAFNQDWLFDVQAI